MATNSQIAFNPQGNTVLLAAAAVPPTAVQAPVNTRFSAQETGQVRMVNAGSATVYLGVGPSAAIALANATAALSLTANGDSEAVIPLVAGAVEVMRLPAGIFFSGLATSASTVYITPGEGL